MNKLSIERSGMLRASTGRRRAMQIIATLPALGLAARAQGAYPERPIRMIVPYGAGTGTDALARRLCTPASKILGQQIIVENRAGGNAIIGAQAAARSNPDGYTMIFGTDHVMCTNPSLVKDLPYSPTNDYVAVAGLVSKIYLLVVSSSSPVQSVADLVALAKSKPGGVTFATTGNGTSGHLASEIFKRDAGIEMTHVPYLGGGQLYPDLLSGRVTTFCYTYELLKPMLDAGSLRAIAVVAERRNNLFPNLTTLVELGYPRSVIESWTAVYAPAGTPADRVARVSEAFKEVLKNPELKSQLGALGMNATYRTPTEQAAFTASELAGCLNRVKIAGVSAA